MRIPLVMVAALAAACSGGAPAGSPAPAPGGAIPASAPAALANGLRIAERFRVDAIADRRFSHAELWSALRAPLQSPALRTREIGASILGRPIRAVTFGAGPTTVLLWSQMHGDESTATMSLADILRFLAEAEGDPLRERLGRELTVTFVPMLNPDGAELFQRENAVGIDVNRDGRRRVTPEAQALKRLRDTLAPQFGFNLHDQGARTRVGERGLQAGIALLAPAHDSTRGYDAVRSRARLVAATIAGILGSAIPGRVAKYDDSFNPRAFGDLMQQWGTSTVLIESGALPGDPQKQRLRALNVAAILGALDAIASGGYRSADPGLYESLPFNTGGANDLLVVGGQVVLPGRPPLAADVAINFDDAVARTGGRVREVGDLRAVVAIDTLDASGLYLHPTGEALTARGDARWLRIGSAASFDVRRGPDAASELVRRIGSPDR
jgi:hypothetical protein